MITLRDGVKFDVEADGYFPSEEGIAYVAGITSVIVAHPKIGSQATIVIESSHDGGSTWEAITYPLPDSTPSFIWYPHHVLQPVSINTPQRLRLRVTGVEEPLQVTMRNR